MSLLKSTSEQAFSILFVDRDTDEMEFVMKELIYLTGQMDLPFFINEIEVLRKYFDNVYVLAYGNENKIECDALARKYNFEYDFVLENQFSFTNIRNMIFNITNKNILGEIKTLIHTKRFNFKNLAYLYYYEWFSVVAENLIIKRLRNDSEIYLYSFWLSRPAYAISKFNTKGKNIKMIVSRSHRYDIYEEENQFKYLPFRKYIDRNLNRIYFSSRDNLDYFKNKAYSKELHAEYFLSYLGTRDFHVRKKYNRGKYEMVFASCSNMIQRKRLDLIISLLSSPAFEKVKIKWLCIGDGELLDEIKSMAQIQLPKVEVFWAGRVSEEDIYKLYIKNDVDFFINMSDSEGVPVSIMEALSLGIPCVARHVGGNADIVNDKNGFLINKNEISSIDLNRLSLKIIEVFNDKERYFCMMDEAFNTWNERFNTEKNIADFCNSIINK